MKKIVYIIVIISVFLTSCSEVLDRAPLDIISSSVLWDDPNLVEAYIANLYLIPGGLRLRKVDESILYNWEYGLVDNLTDQCGMTRSNRPAARWKRGDLTASNPGLMQCWDYGLIRKINEFYKEMETSTMSAEDKKRLIGQVKWLEAFTYWEMGKNYGGVPIIRTAQTINDPYEELYPPRNKEVEVYDYAISKLDEIISQDLLPVTGTKTGLPGRGAALALKSRIALYAASLAKWGTVQLDGVVGIDPSREAGFWQQAYDAANEVISPSTHTAVYSLYPIDENNRSESYQKASVDKSNPEWIFYVDFDGEYRISDFTRRTLPTCFDKTTFYLTAPYLDFIEYFQLKDGSSGKIPDALFQPNVLVDVDELFKKYDPRMDGSILRQNSVFLGKVCDFYSALKTEDGTILKDKTGIYNGVRHVGLGRSAVDAQTLLNTGFGVSKRMNNQIILEGLDNVGFCILRLTEVILNRAEAAYYLGKTDQALSDVNLIRTRAGLPAHSAITNEEQIRYERNVEMFFEEIHYFDLKRWRKSVEAITKSFSGLEYTKDYATGKFLLKKVKYTATGTPYVSRFLEKHYYLPLGPSKIANNPQLVENPGY